MELYRLSTQTMSSSSQGRVVDGFSSPGTDRTNKQSPARNSRNQIDTTLQNSKRISRNSSNFPTTGLQSAARRSSAKSSITAELSRAKVSAGPINQTQRTIQNQSNLLSPVKLSAGSSAGIAETIKRVLTPDGTGRIHEEELQYAIVVHLLEANKSGTGDEFAKLFDAAIAAGLPPIGTEDCVKKTLGRLVTAGEIDLHTAEQINGASFEAAQLDNYKNLLFDGTAGPNDATTAVMGIDEAAAAAQISLKKMEQVDSGVFSRSLTAPSNGVLSTLDLNRSGDLIRSGDLNRPESLMESGNLPGSDSASSSSGSAAAINPKGFLWKPISDNNGKLVVLLPKSLTGNVSNCAVYRDLPPTPENLLELGRFSGDQSNGDRSHFRFNHPGSYYPQKCYVVAGTKQGSEVAFEIVDSRLRNSV